MEGSKDNAVRCLTESSGFDECIKNTENDGFNESKKVGSLPANKTISSLKKP